MQHTSGASTTASGLDALVARCVDQATKRRRGRCAPGATEPGQTLMFLDWDDTLFPTTEIFERRQLQSNRESWSLPVPRALEHEIGAWREALTQHIAVALSLSDRCVIVTNSTRPWVHRCIDRFAPHLRPLLHEKPRRLRVVYASEVQHVPNRGDSSSQGVILPDDLLPTDRNTTAKLIAMHREASKFYVGRDWGNILSFGDMVYERDALRQLRRLYREPSAAALHTKAVLLPSRPSMEGLTSWLRSSLALLPTYVRFRGDFDMDFRKSPDILQIRLGCCLPKDKAALRDTPVLRQVRAAHLSTTRGVVTGRSLGKVFLAAVLSVLNVVTVRKEAQVLSRPCVIAAVAAALAYIRRFGDVCAQKTFRCCSSNFALVQFGQGAQSGSNQWKQQMSSPASWLHTFLRGSAQDRLAFAFMTLAAAAVFLRWPRVGTRASLAALGMTGLEGSAPLQLKLVCRHRCLAHRCRVIPRPGLSL